VSVTSKLDAMDEVDVLCRRVLGPGSAAEEAAARARASGTAGRLTLLAAAAAACRELSEGENGELEPAGPPASDGRGLVESVAAELAAASAKLPERQREALVLRELLHLSHEQMAEVMGVDASAAAPLLARARLRFRAERRGTETELGPDCAERDRSLRLLACRQDSEPLSSDDDSWLLTHLGECRSCQTAHAAMLEASVCYRAWPVQ